MLAYQDFKNNEAQTKASADIYAKAFAEAMTGIEVEFSEGNLDDVISSAKAKAAEASVEIPTHWGSPGPPPTLESASGYNNAKGFAGGKHSNG